MKAQQHATFCSSGSKRNPSEPLGNLCLTLSLPSTNVMLQQVLLKSCLGKVRRIVFVNTCFFFVKFNTSSKCMHAILCTLRIPGICNNSASITKQNNHEYPQSRSHGTNCESFCWLAAADPITNQENKTNTHAYRRVLHLYQCREKIEPEPTSATLNCG